MQTTYQPSEIERELALKEKEFSPFIADARSSKPAFSIVIPPPNVTGVLHMGHALVNTLQDIIVRFKRMSGYETLWVPGTDHAGIATQTVVERRSITLFNKRRIDYPRDEFVALIQKWKDEHQAKILHQLSSLGLSCDFSRTRFTMDEQCSKAVFASFYHLFQKGLIYKGDYLVNWDPVTQTALSDDEVEYEEEKSFLWFIRFSSLNGKESLTVATTRPETLMGDVALAAHPDDLRFSTLFGSLFIHPVTKKQIPLIADKAIDPDFGTGVVKITPAHDPLDYEIAQRHNLPMINIMTTDGKVNENGAPFEGMTFQDARQAVVAYLRKEGHLIKEEAHIHRVGKSYRSKATIEPYLSKQWFVRMEPCKAKLMEAVKNGEVKLHPAYWEKTYFHWIENLKDWCISRQLWWGHRIPVWYHIDDPLCMVVSPDGKAPPEVLENPELWQQDNDVLDTWFSSALWPFSTMGWPDATEDFNKFYPTSLLITGHDILFFWVARMMMMADALTGKWPFKEVFLHGLIYARSYWKVQKDGSCLYLSAEERKGLSNESAAKLGIESRFEKMSKSKGNVIDPLEVIAEYGTDALRLTLASITTDARQIDLDERRFLESHHFMNKIWNGARFILSHFDPSIPIDLEMVPHRIDDRWILSRLMQTTKQIQQSLGSYQFNHYATAVYRFFWDELCAVYLETSKPILFGKEGSSKDRADRQNLLLAILFWIIRLFHPLIPFITEALYALIREKCGEHPHFQAPLCSLLSFPLPKSELIDLQAEELFEKASLFLYAIRNLRGKMQVSPGETLDLILVHPQIDLEMEKLGETFRLLRALTKIGTIHTLTHSENLPFGATQTVGEIVLILPMSDEQKQKEIGRLEKEIEKISIQLDHYRNKLSQEEFIAKAPPALVEKTQKQHDELKYSLASLKEKLIELSSPA